MAEIIFNWNKLEHFSWNNRKKFLWQLRRRFRFRFVCSEELKKASAGRAVGKRKERKSRVVFQRKDLLKECKSIKEEIHAVNSPHWQVGGPELRTEQGGQSLGDKRGGPFAIGLQYTWTISVLWAVTEYSVMQYYY